MILLYVQSQNTENRHTTWLSQQQYDNSKQY